MNSENYVVIQGWMCNELALKGNDLLVFALIYGFSQDNESVYSGGRNYIAETFNISLPTVDKALNNLVSAGYIEKETETINNVVFNRYKVSLGVVKKLYGGSKETLPNNINKIKHSNNDVSKDTSSKEQSDFQFGDIEKPQKVKKPNLFDKCLFIIDEWTNLPELKELLIQYLKLCLEMNSIRGANQWKGMLNTLEKVQMQCHPHTFEEIVEQSINRGWKTFYPINDYNNKKGSNENFKAPDTTNDGLNHIKAVDENGNPLVF